MIELYLKVSNGETAFLGVAPSFSVYATPKVGQNVKFNNVKYKVLDVEHCKFSGKTQIIVDQDYSNDNV